MISNHLPTDYQAFYYVYCHQHPVEGSIVYVGMGQKGRAWSITNSGGDNAAYGNRSQNHYNWFLTLEANGHTLDEVVNIVAKGLTKREALDFERELIDDCHPVFNKVAGLNILKMTEEKYLAAVAMRQDGLSYSAIGTELELSPMTAYRALNGQTKNIGEDYGK